MQHIRSEISSTVIEYLLLEPSDEFKSETKSPHMSSREKWNLNMMAAGSKTTEWINHFWVKFSGLYMELNEHATGHP